MLTGICAFDFVSYAQDNIPKGGTVRGELSEATPEREPIEGAEIKLISEDGKEYVKKSDATGKYKFTGIPGGRYSLKVTKAGYRDRIKNPLVLAEGGESYHRILMFKGNHGQRRLLVDAKQNKNKLDMKKLEELIQHVSIEIAQLYDLNETTLKNLQKTVMDTVKTAINKNGSLLKQTYPYASAEGNLSLIVLLLRDKEIKASFTNYITETQLQSFIDNKKQGRQQVGKTLANFLTVYLDQTLSLTSKQREDLTEMLYKWTESELYSILSDILTLSLPGTIADYIHRRGEKSIKDILTDEQYEIWQEIGEAAKSLNRNVNVDLKHFDGKEVVSENKEHALTRRFHIHKLTDAILNLHTKQFQTLNDSAKERFALVNKGIVEQYIEKLHRKAIKRTSLMGPYADILIKGITGQISRNIALQKIKPIKKEYWEDSYANNVKDDDPQVVNPDINQVILNQAILPSIFNVVKEPIYQQTIKDSISQVEYEKYSKRQSEIENMRQHAAQNLVVALLDMHILLNTNQRKKIEDIASKLTIPELSRIGLQFMFLELYLNINPDDLSKWQQKALMQGVFFK